MKTIGGDAGDAPLPSAWDYRHRPVAHDLRRARTAEGLRLPYRRDRPVRHRRDPADDGGGPRPSGQERAHQPGRWCGTWARSRSTGRSSCAHRDRLLDGITPGGATPASFMATAVAQRFSKHPQQFGKGAIEGVVAPETAAHAAGTRRRCPCWTLAFLAADCRGAARRLVDSGPAARADAVPPSSRLISSGLIA